MTPMCVIARRELSSLFFSPIAYVVLGLFSLGTSLIFLMSYAPGQPASMRPTFDGVIWLMIFLVPAISMRLISEELRSGTIELLMTSPINDTQVVVGKWLGAMGFLMALMLPLLILVGVLQLTARPDYGPIVTGFIGLLLVGGLYLAIGTFASAISQNQIISFLLTVFVICMLTFVLFFLPQAAFVRDEWRGFMYHLNVNMQFDNFNKGLIDWPNLVYFISLIGLFLFLAVQLVQSKRWR